MAIVVLVRGVPGAGKSTFANHIADVVLSADDYFIDKNGNYVFDKNNHQKAHDWCFDKYKFYITNNNLDTKWQVLAVANTFTREWEFQRYFDYAKRHNMTVFTIVVENRHNSCSIHNVPADVVNAMRDRFEFQL